MSGSATGHEVKHGVIAALQPPSNIQVLRIAELRPSCDVLPSWITSLDNLTKLTLDDGRNVSSLPPLGKLRSLKNLCISKFNALKMIGREFIGLGSKPDKNCSYFPKLVELEFCYCYELIGWEDLKPEEEDSISVMPNLEKLVFKECSKLDKLPPRLLGQAPSLKRISIEQYESSFKFRVGESQSPCTLSFRYGPKTHKLLCRYQNRLEMIVERSTKVPKSIISPSYITLLDIYFAELRFSSLPSMGNLPYLQSLSIDNLSSLELIGRDFLGIDDPNNDEEFVAFPHLLKIEITRCGLLKEWEDLKAEDERKVTVMPKLQRLDVTGCPKLRVLPSRLLCQAASLEDLRCYDNKSLAKNIQKDEQLLRHVKKVSINGYKCSLHQSTKRKGIIC